MTASATERRRTRTRSLRSALHSWSAANFRYDRDTRMRPPQRDRRSPYRYRTQYLVGRGVLSARVPGVEVADFGQPELCAKSQCGTPVPIRCGRVSSGMGEFAQQDQRAGLADPVPSAAL
jgi:hypothetical protein